MALDPLRKLPDMLAQLGVLTLDASQVFHSDRVMVKHSNEYRAPKPGEKPRINTLVSAESP